MVHLYQENEWKEKSDSGTYTPLKAGIEPPEGLEIKKHEGGRKISYGEEDQENGACGPFEESAKWHPPREIPESTWNEHHDDLQMRCRDSKCIW